MVQPSAPDLADPHAGALPRNDFLAYPALPEALEEILEGRARVSFSKRAGERPTLFVIDGGVLRDPEIRDTEKRAEPTAAARACASEVVVRQIPAAMRAFEDSGLLGPYSGAHGEVPHHRGLRARQTIVWPNGRHRLERERYRASQARFDSSSRLSQRRFMIPSRMPSPSYTVP